MSYTKDREVLLDKKGLLLPSAWDKDGNVTSISFYSQYEEEFQIVPECVLFKELLNYLKTDIVLTGVIKDQNGIKQLNVKEYSLPVV